MDPMPSFCLETAEAVGIGRRRIQHGTPASLTRLTNKYFTFFYLTKIFKNEVSFLFIFYSCRFTNEKITISSS